MERYVIDRAAKRIGQIFGQDIFSGGFRTCKEEIFPLQKTCDGHFQDLFSIERNGRSGNSSLYCLIHAIVFPEFLDTVDQVFGNVLFF